LNSGFKRSGKATASRRCAPSRRGFLRRRSGATRRARYITVTSVRATAVLCLPPLLLRLLMLPCCPCAACLLLFGLPLTPLKRPLSIRRSRDLSGIKARTTCATSPAACRTTAATPASKSHSSTPGVLTSVSCPVRPTSSHPSASLSSPAIAAKDFRGTPARFGWRRRVAMVIYPTRKCPTLSSARPSTSAIRGRRCALCCA